MQSVLSGKTEKLDCWRPQGIPLDEAERARIRQLCVEAVFAIWNTEYRPAQLSEIWDRVKGQTVHGKRTVDRRVNEAASLLFCEKGQIPKIVAVSAGLYMVNPKLFEESRP